MRKPLVWVSGLVLATAAGCSITRADALLAIDQIATRQVTIHYYVDCLQSVRPYRLVRMDEDRRYLDWCLPSPGTLTYRIKTIQYHMTVRYPSEMGPQVALVDATMRVRGERWIPTLNPENVLPVLSRVLKLPGYDRAGMVYAGGFEHRERFRLPLAGVEVGELLGALVAQGFFDQPPRPDVGVTLSVEIEGMWDRKFWHPLPVFDILADRVRLTGEVIEYMPADEELLDQLRGGVPATRPTPE